MAAESTRADSFEPKNPGPILFGIWSQYVENEIILSRSPSYAGRELKTTISETDVSKLLALLARLDLTNRSTVPSIEMLDNLLASVPTDAISLLWCRMGDVLRQRNAKQVNQDSVDKAWLPLPAAKKVQSPRQYSEISDVPTCLFYESPEFTKKQYDEELKRRDEEDELYNMPSDDYDVEAKEIPVEWALAGFC